MPRQSGIGSNDYSGSADEPKARLDLHGFVVLPAIVPANECDRVAQLLGRPATGRAGSRALLNEAWCRDLSAEIARHPQIASLLPADAVAVQCTLFEKSPENNWLVAFHQDLSIPVAARVGSNACTGWSEKDGLTFVQPPMDVLTQMLAVRLQIDEPAGRDGALRVVPGSHRNGKVPSGDLASFRATQEEVCHEVERGGALVLRPLLLHASSKITGARPRRVLHFLFGPASLPHGLRWPDWPANAATPDLHRWDDASDSTRHEQS
jgi:ectoine hydroxylase-related dioxygenase (phytanoyl-CoA dioxygenase family)